MSRKVVPINFDRYRILKIAGVHTKLFGGHQSVHRQSGFEHGESRQVFPLQHFAWFTCRILPVWGRLRESSRNC